MLITAGILWGSAFCVLSSLVHAGDFEKGFQHPPEETKPWCYWYWLNNEVTADGITKDLENMAEVGIKLAMIGNVHTDLESAKPGNVKVFSPEWYALTRHALREAHRVGVDIYMFNAPGWSQTGGPWVEPDQSKRRVIWNEVSALGGPFSAKVRNEPQAIMLQAHDGTGQSIRHEPQDIAVLAVPRKPAVRVHGQPPSALEDELTLQQAGWIWYPSENAASSAPAETRHFQRSFKTDPAALTAAEVRLTADNSYVLKINGHEVKRDTDFKSMHTVSILKHLKPGENVLTVEVTNDGPTPNPAGLIAAIRLQPTDGAAELLVTDNSWKASRNGADGWQAAERLGAVAMAPWGLTDSGRPENVLVFERDKPFTARALVIQGKVNGQLFAVENGERTLVAAINTDERNPTTDFLPDGIETFSFQEVTARQFVLEPCNLDGEKVMLTSEPMVAQVIEKQMGRMHPTPIPSWESYIFPATVEPGDPATVIRRNEILNLTDKLGADGVLTCTLPAGEWDILYFGMVSTGKVNSPAPPEATGLELCKMSRPLVEDHFNAMFGELLEQLTPEERAAFTGITIDSYEKGSQNWTDDFDQAFQKRNGYDPLALLPVFTGRVVDSAKVSDQFLWDLRRTVADMIATEYVGGLRDIANRNNLKLWCENYGHWGFPGEFLIYGGHADEIGGEFWTNWYLGPIECRAASSAAHIYGKQRVYCEAFTSFLDLNHHPYSIKARGEQLFCEGINHFVLSTYTHQPRDGVPGRNPGFGTAVHRNNPWFNQSRDWVKYLQRVHFMLQQGEPVLDVAVYIGDFAPQMTGPADPVPSGYDYDYMGSDALLRTVQAKDGEMLVHDEKDPKRISTRYQVLAIDPRAIETVRPLVRKRLDELAAAGIPFVNQLPVPEKRLRELGITPLVSAQSCGIRWKARRLDDGMIFFMSNFAQTGTFEATLRVKDKTPVLYNPATGRITKIARYQTVDDGTRITINVTDLADSFFVVFRDKSSQPSVVKVEANGAAVAPAELDLYYDANGTLRAESAKKGTYSLTMSDASEKSVVIDRDQTSLPVAGPWKSENVDAEGFSVKLQTSVNVPADFGKNQRRLYLDLGQVTIMAKVTLNGKEFETLWMPPFVLDVTGAVKPGENKLEVLVTSTSNGKPKLGDAVALKSVSINSVR